MRSIYNLYKKQRVLSILLVVAILTMLIVAPTAARQASDPIDDFIAPTPIADPQTPDEEFFNMRLQFFLPETEPLIKEAFGQSLLFEDAAFWEYESYYSRAVSFATNLPTLAKIEYGPTAEYGLSTSQTEFYYYQHLMHLTGLEPGNTYHYRILAKGSDGAFLTSQDYTFATPEVPGGVIRIPQDLADQSLPYKLTTPGAKYLLTQDVYAPNGGIVLKAHNIELDLGGHTVTYDMKPNPITYDNLNNGNSYLYDEEATFGVRCGMWNFRDQKIFNGNVVQGANGGEGCNGSGYNPIMFTHVTGIEIGGVAVDYYGDSVNGICGDNDNFVHHNVVYDRGSVIDNRHSQMRAITLGGGANEVAYNSVRRCRQTGVAGGVGALQYGNEIYGDSFAPNSFLLGYNTNSISTGNKIFGLGYNPIGIGGGNMRDASATGNFIYLHAYAPNQRDTEYNRLSGVAGFRPQIYESELGPFGSLLFKDNVIVCKAWPGASYIRALWVCSDANQDGLRIANNIVKVEAMSEEDIDFTNAEYCFACVDFQGAEGTSELPAVRFEDNRFITNVNFLVIGTGYGIGRSAAFYRNSFEKIDHHDSYFWPFRMGFWFWSSTHNKLVDSSSGPGVDLSLPPKVIGTIEARITLDVGVSSQRAYADAATGAPLAYTTIAWQLDGGGQGSFATDGNGEAYREWLTTLNEHRPGDPASSVRQTHNSTVTFIAAGYEPVTKNIADVQGMGSPILFGGKAVIDPDPEPDIDPKLVAEDFRGSGGLDANTIHVNFWSRSAFDGAEVYRSDTAEGPFVLAKTEQGSPTYSYTGLKPDTTYYFKVRLFQGGHFGPLSNAIAVKTGDVTAEDFRGSGGLDANTVYVNFWSRSAFDGAEVYRSDTAEGPFVLAKTEQGNPTYSYTGLKPGTTYYFKVRLFQGGHFGPLSNAIAVKTGDVTAEDFRGSGGLDANTVYVNFWSRSAFDGAEVYRSDTAEGPFVLAKTEQGSPTYSYTGLKPDTTYYFKVRLFQGGHFGPLSNAIALKTGVVTAEDFRGRANANCIELSWWCRSAWESAELFRSAAIDGEFLRIGSTGSAPFLDYGIASGQTYYYKIRLIQGSHYGAYTQAIAFTAQ